MRRKIRAAAGRLWRGELSGCALVGWMHLSTLLHASGTERKVLLFEWMVFGPVGETFGAETVLELFGASRCEQADEGRTCEYLCVHLAERYDERLAALFYLAAEMEVESSGLCFMTTYIPLAGDGLLTTAEQYAAWPDASMALMSYYGQGEAETAGVGFYGEDDAAA